MKGGMFVMAWRPWNLCRYFYWLMELVLYDGAASVVVAVEPVVAAVHTAVEIFVALTFAVDLDLGARFFAAVFVDVAHEVVAVLAAAAVGLDTAHAEHDVVGAAADVEGVAVDNASPLLWACLYFVVGAAA